MLTFNMAFVCYESILYYLRKYFVDPTPLDRLRQQSYLSWVRWCTVLDAALK